MKEKIEFKVKHTITKTSKEEKELHMKQAYAALNKMAKEKLNAVTAPRQS